MHPTNESTLTTANQSHPKLAIEFSVGGVGHGTKTLQIPGRPGRWK
jgi:hypothetical protein